MKRTSAILILLFFCIQAIAKEDLFPPTMLGYYEGAGMGLYLDRDGLRMIDLGMTADAESRSMRDPHFYTLSNQGLLLKKKGEVNGISTYSTISQGKHQHNLLIEFLSSASLKMKIGQSPWKEFDREVIQIEHYQKLFKLKDELEKELFVEQLLLPQGFQKLDQKPASFEGLWKSEYQYYVILEDKIIIGHEVYEMKEVYRTGEAGNFLYALKTWNRVKGDNKLFLFKEVENQLFLQEFCESELVLNEYERAYNQLRTLGQNHTADLSWQEFNDRFYSKYFQDDDGLIKTDFRSSIQLNRDGTVEIDGHTSELVGVAEILIHGEKAAQIDSPFYAVSIVLSVMDAANEMSHLQVFFKGDEFLFFNMSEKGALYRRAGYLLGTWLDTFLMFTAAFILLLFLLYRIIWLPRKLKQRLSQVQLEGIKSQLNPHFLFNSISSIQSLMNQGKTEKANIYLNDFSDLLRYHLDEGAEDLVLLSEELAALQHYCQLEKLRSPFQFEMEVDTQLDTEQIEIPNQILQIVVENAIKHGLRFTDTPILNIRLQKIEQQLRISILDNGPGIHNAEHRPSPNLTMRKTHKGLDLIHEKIKLLKKKGIKLKIAIKDRRLDLLEDESGTRVTLDIPLTY